MHYFTDSTRHWFGRAFPEPTEVQARGWSRIADGDHTLLIAPTGSGKTLAAFLYALDRLGRLDDDAAPGVRVVYVSPLKALVYDIERNLRTPLAGIERAAAQLGERYRHPRVDVRTGDTAPADRRRQQREPGEIMVTTPESLFLLLGSQARETFRTVQWVIVDEIHAMAATKRGAHLALSLERLSRLADEDPQRIGLSATARPPEEVARFLGGDRPVSVVDAHVAPLLDLGLVVPVEDMTRPVVETEDAAWDGRSGPNRDSSDDDARDHDSRAEPDADSGTHRHPHPETAGSSAPRSTSTPRAHSYPRSDSDHPSYVVLGADQAPSGSLMLAEEEEVTRQYGIWPAVYPEILKLIRGHRTTLVFVNSRGLCERLAQRLNELAGEELVRAHHGSLAHHQRREIEEALKAGTLPAIVATSSLELGIDMGAVDLVILVESPGSVSSGLQRVGRAGHRVGEPSIGRIFPKHRGDLLEAAVVAHRMREGEIEALRVPRNPLDVLAQHIVAMAAVQPWRVADLTALVRRSASFRELPDPALTAVLDMLSGLYPSTEFSELRPRINWDRERDVIEGRPGARMLAAVNAGTIPDRGLFGVFLGEDGPRVGELDEEMVHESQPGQTFTLGATTWRIQDITRDRVIVEPAPGEPGRLPFWKGEGPGRPLELGRALGAFTRELGGMPGDDAVARLTGDYGLDPRAARNLVDYLLDQRSAAGTLPTDRDITVERFRDELGDWRICILTPFGARVHAPWALAIRADVSERVGYDVQAVWSDDGIVLTLAAGDEPPDVDMLIPHPDEIEDRILEELARSPLFASHFRENAARALLLPRRRPGQRTPLFAQRLRAQKLLSIAMRYPSFPIVVETYRSVLQDVFDVPSLKEVLRDIESRAVRVHEVETAGASPFARSLVYAYVAAYLYEGDSPAAERRAQALAVDVELLRELLGEADLRELLDAAVIAEVEDQLQHRSEPRRARHPDALHDLLRQLGDLTSDELRDRAAEDPTPWLEGLERARRVARVRVPSDAPEAAGAAGSGAGRAGRQAWIAVEDAGLYRDALGVAPPSGVAAVFLEPVERPVEALLLRWARTHGPFTAAEVAARFGLVLAQAAVLLGRVAEEGRLLRGEFRPGSSGQEWVDPEVLRQVKRRTIAKLRGQVAPVPPEALARFLPAWHRADGDPYERVEEAVIQLEGIPLSYRELVRSILPARVRDFAPAMLDELGAMGWLVWVGHSPLRSDDGRILLYRRDRVDRLLVPPALGEAGERIEAFADPHRRILEHLDGRGASFQAELAAALPDIPPPELLAAVWDLVWAGLVTNDTFAALRSLGMAIDRRTPRSREARARDGDGARGAATGGGRRRRGGMRRWRPTGLAAASGPLGAPGGRWSLVRDLVRDPTSSTERAAAWAATLLDRHGLVARETAQVEALGGGFSGVYRVLRSMEEQGRARRGYFVEGLGGAQFAYPGIVDRLRRVRDGEDEGRVVTLAASDPANPYGWLLPWPELRDPRGRAPTRSTGADVVMLDGRPVLFLDRKGRRLRTFEDADPDAIRAALPALRDVARTHPRRSLSIEKVDGEAAFRSALKPLLEAAGFVSDYRYLRITG